MKTTLFTLILSLFSSAPLYALEPISPPGSPIVIFQADAGFDDTKEFLQLAITDRGIKIRSTLHISTMLERTAKDTGQTQQLYGKAESLEFCSVVLSYQMSAAHPANLSICPLTISLYTLPDDPEHTFVSYAQPKLLGNKAGEVEQQLMTLFNSIIESALE